MMRKEDRKTTRRPFGSGKTGPKCFGHFCKDSPRITQYLGGTRETGGFFLLVSNFARSILFPYVTCKNQHLEANVMEVDGSDDFPDFNCMIRLASSR